MHAEKIIQIRPIGKQRTVDITVKSDNHVFYGNGIVGSNSHAYAYGEIAIWTAFAKAHFPQEFYCSYLRHAKDKEKYQFWSTTQNGPS